MPVTWRIELRSPDANRRVASKVGIRQVPQLTRRPPFSAKRQFFAESASVIIALRQICWPGGMVQVICRSYRQSRMTRYRQAMALPADAAAYAVAGASSSGNTAIIGFSQKVRSTDVSSSSFFWYPAKPDAAWRLLKTICSGSVVILRSELYNDDLCDLALMLSKYAGIPVRIDGVLKVSAILCVQFGWSIAPAHQLASND